MVQVNQISQNQQQTEIDPIQEPPGIFQGSLPTDVLGRTFKIPQEENSTDINHDFDPKYDPFKKDQNLDDNKKEGNLSIDKFEELKQKSNLLRKDYTNIIVITISCVLALLLIIVIFMRMTSRNLIDPLEND